MRKKEIPVWLSEYTRAVQKQENKHQKDLAKKERLKTKEKNRENETVLQRGKVEAGLREDWKKLKINEIVDDVFRFTTKGSISDEEATSEPYVSSPLLIKLDWGKRLYKQLLDVLPEKEDLVLQGGIFYDFEGWDFDQDSGKDTNYGGRRHLFSISLSENFFIIDQKEIWPRWQVGNFDQAKMVVGRYLARKVGREDSS